MVHRFVIRRLGSLPWPSGLGKNAGPNHPYKQLERQLRAYLGDDRHFSATAHKRAYLTEDPEYRRIVLYALTRRRGAQACSMTWRPPPTCPDQRPCSTSRWPSILSGTTGRGLTAATSVSRVPGWQPRCASLARRSWTAGIASHTCDFTARPRVRDLGTRGHLDQSGSSWSVVVSGFEDLDFVIVCAVDDPVFVVDAP